MIAEEFAIEYGASRPLKFKTYVIDSEEKEWFLDAVMEFVAVSVNIETADAMDEQNLYRLIEKISILVCKAESPTANYGITKPEVRSAVKYAIKATSAATYRGEQNKTKVEE
jgi:hypothetical protein